MCRQNEISEVLLMYSQSDQQEDCDAMRTVCLCTPTVASPQALKPSKSGLMSPYEASTTRWIHWIPCVPRTSGSWQRISPPSEWTRADVTAFWRTQGSQRLWENTQIQHPDRLNSWTGWNHLGRTIQRETIIQQPGVSAWGWSNLRTNTVSDLLDDPRQEYNPQGSATCRLAECEDQKLTDQRSWTFQKPLRRRNFNLSVALRSNRYL